MATVTEAQKSEALKAKNEGNEFYKQRKFEEAISCYVKAAELDPTDMTFLTNKAAVYLEQGKFEESIKECEKAIEIGRENRADFKTIAKAYSRMATCYRKLGEFEKAKMYFEKSLTEHRTPETVTKLSEVTKIIKENERKAYIDPEKAAEEKNLGNELFKKGDYPGAIKHYNEAIKRNPDDAKLFSNRAACYQKLAEFDLALKDCEECTRLDPNFVRGYIRQGHALMAKKDYAKARKAIEKALALEPNNKEAQDVLSRCFQNSFDSSSEDKRKRALSDPEIQSILADPAMQLILQQMQNDPKALEEHLKNPVIKSKILKLIESGFISLFNNGN